MIDGGELRGIVRTIRIEYPVPYLTVILAVFSLASLGLSTTTPWPTSAASAAIGAMAGLGAVGLPIYAALFRRELLRSEKFSLAVRYIDALEDNEMDPDARERLGKVIDGFAEPPVPRRVVLGSAKADRDREASDG